MNDPLKRLLFACSSVSDVHHKAVGATAAIIRANSGGVGGVDTSDLIKSNYYVHAIGSGAVPGEVIYKPGLPACRNHFQVGFFKHNPSSYYSLTWFK